MQNPLFQAAIRRVLRPLVRAMIGRGLLFQEFSDLAKRVFLEVAEKRFALPGKRMTDSRISLLTGLQRRDVRQHKQSRNEDEDDPPAAGPLPRVIAHWMGSAPFSADGAPIPLTRTGEGASFEALVAAVSRDMHSRTIFDELLRLGLVRHDAAADRVTLLSPVFTTQGDDSYMLGYFGANLGDHAEASADNLLADPSGPPHYERAVHYNHLSKTSLAVLDELSRELQDAALARINMRALALQKQDEGDPQASGRFRSGAYIYCKAGQVAEEDET